MNESQIKFRIRYADTDHLGVVYYARYLEWLEAARTEILRENGISYKEFEDQGLFAPVVHVMVDYFKPAKYDDQVLVKTKISSVGNVSITFEYVIYKENESTPIAKAKTVNVFISRSGEKKAVPDIIRKIVH